MEQKIYASGIKILLFDVKTFKVKQITDIFLKKMMHQKKEDFYFRKIPCQVQTLPLKTRIGIITSWLILETSRTKDDFFVQICSMVGINIKKQIPLYLQAISQVEFKKKLDFNKKKYETKELELHEEI